MTSKKYSEQVYAFNRAAKTSYIASVNFLKFRHTKKGVLVSCYAAHPNELMELKRNVARAGEPYYTK